MRHASRAVVFYLTPDFSRLSDPLVWLAAFGQAFFSLGVGTGIMLTYGSYLGGGRLVRDALVIAAADLLVALLAGFMVFPIVFSGGAVVLLGLPPALSYTALRVELFGARLLDLKDFAFGTVGMVVAGVILSVSAGWFFDTRAVLEHLRLGPAWRRAFLALVRYFIPLALSANLVARLAGRG